MPDNKRLDNIKCQRQYRKAQDFLILAANGKSREAFSLFAEDGFKHHNIHFKGDADTLITAMEVNAKSNPGLIFGIKIILHDGKVVAVHLKDTNNS